MERFVRVLLVAALLLVTWVSPSSAACTGEAGYTSSYFTTTHTKYVYTSEVVEVTITSFTPGSPGVKVALYNMQTNRWHPAGYILTSAAPGPVTWVVPCGIYKVQINTAGPTQASGVVKIETTGPAM